MVIVAYYVSRLRSRTGHYARTELLPSQLATLELGDDVIVVDGELPPRAVADEVLRATAPLSEDDR